jgi:hypothetical protein
MRIKAANRYTTHVRTVLKGAGMNGASEMSQRTIPKMIAAMTKNRMA